MRLGSSPVSVHDSVPMSVTELDREGPAFPGLSLPPSESGIQVAAEKVCAL